MASSSSVFDNKENKLARIEPVEPGEEISRQKFNLIMGATLTWGILLDVFLAVALSDYIIQIPPIAMIIGYFVVAIGCTVIIYKSDKPIVSFLAFTGLSLAMGVLIVFAIQGYTEASVMDAFVGTALITVLMMGLSTLFPDFFIGLGKMLFIALIGVLLFEIITILIGMHPNWINLVVLVIFCGYIGYDWGKTQKYVPTVDRAIDSAADIYVDVVNVFIRLLAIFGNSK